MNLTKVWAGAATVVIVAIYAFGSSRWVDSGGEWYRALRRPAWQPPDALFGIAWTYNFAAIVVAGVVVSMHGSNGQRWTWLAALAASVIAALSWAWLFYIRHALWSSAVALLVAALVTAVVVQVAWTTRWWAGAVLLPYILWLAVATSLAFGYASLNRG
jgi:tryptophan-rich sensory protein